MKFFKVEIKIHPASVPMDKFSSRDWPTYDWNHERIEPCSVITETVNVINVPADTGDNALTKALADLIQKRIIELGREEIYTYCPDEEKQEEVTNVNRD